MVRRRQWEQKSSNSDEEREHLVQTHGRYGAAPFSGGQRILLVSDEWERYKEYSRKCLETFAVLSNEWRYGPAG